MEGNLEGNIVGVLALKEGNKVPEIRGNEGESVELGCDDCKGVGGRIKGVG
jgi:hypothetical protein